MKRSTTKGLIKGSMMILAIALMGPLINAISILFDIVLGWIFSRNIDPLWSMLLSVPVIIASIITTLLIPSQCLMPRFERLIDRIDFDNLVYKLGSITIPLGKHTSMDIVFAHILFTLPVFILMAAPAVWLLQRKKNETEQPGPVRGACNEVL